jgi:hypothetical protein
MGSAGEQLIFFPPANLSLNCPPYKGYSSMEFDSSAQSIRGHELIEKTLLYLSCALYVCEVSLFLCC